MSHDDYLRQKRSQRNLKVKHPYAAIEHRVIDSLAFASLKHSSARLLLILARQLNRDNNGHLQATWTYSKQRGLGSENTLRDAINELIQCGFIYRTRSRGANRVPALYAVTWLSITRREGLYLQGFNKDGWKAWEEKKHPPKNDALKHQFLSFRGLETSESDGNRPSKTDDYELVPCTGALRGESSLRDPGQWL